MEKHIWLRKGKRRWLLLRDGDCFHLVEENEALTAETQKLLLETIHTPEQMQALGLSGETVCVGDLQGIAVYGNAAGDDLEFHFDRWRKRGWVLDQRYMPRELDDFFRGIPRIPIPGKRLVKGGRKGDWRSREQDPKIRKRMLRIGLCLNVASICVAALLLFSLGRQVSAAVLGCGVICVILGLCLGIFYQEYFTFLSGKSYRASGGTSRVSELWGPTVLMFLLALCCFRTCYYFDLTPVIAYGATAGGLVGILGILLIQDMRTTPANMAGCIFVCALLGVCLIGPLNSATGKEEPVSHVVTLEEKWKKHRSKGSDDYNCRFLFDDGRTLTVDVGRTAYEEYEIGDEIRMLTRTGGLGIEYAWFE